MALLMDQILVLGIPAYGTVGPSTNPGYENPVCDSISGIVNPGKYESVLLSLL